MEPNSLWARVISSIHSSHRDCSPIPWKNNMAGAWKSMLGLKSHLDQFDIALERLFTGSLGNGESLRFWLDCWSDNEPLYMSFPSLYKLERYKNCLVKDRCTGRGSFSQWEWSWSRPPSSTTELHQLQSMLSQIIGVTLSSTNDSWIWNLDPSRQFTVKSMRTCLQTTINARPSNFTNIIKFNIITYNSSKIIKIHLNIII